MIAHHDNYVLLQKLTAKVFFFYCQTRDEKATVYISGTLLYKIAQ